MADRYLITGGGSVNWNANGSWAATDGGATGATFPVAGDRVFLTALSGVGSLAINVASACGDFDCTGYIGTLNGGGILTCGGNFTLVAAMTLGGSPGITFNASSGTKVITSAGKNFQGGWIFNGAATFQLADSPNLLNTAPVTLTAGTFDANGKTVTLGSGISTIAGAFSGSSSFFNLTKSSNNSLSSIIIDHDLTVAGTLDMSSTAATKRPLFQSSVMGTPMVVTVATATISDVDFRDITGAGAAAPFTGTRLGDAKGNSGITFTTPANKFYVGNTANWDGTVWALSSGGVAGANNFPLPQDSAIFDANSFSANSQTVTVNASFRLPGIDFSAITKTGITFATSNFCSHYGDIVLEAQMVTSGTQTRTLAGRNTQQITSAGVSWTNAFTLDSLGGTMKPADAFTTTGAVLITNGTFDINGQVCTALSFSGSNSNVREIKSSSAGGKLVTTTTSGNSLAFAIVTNLTITRNSWTIEIGGNTATIRTFAGGGAIWPAVTFTNSTAGGGINFTGSNTFKSLAYTGGTAQTFGFTAGTTTTIEDANGFPSGTAGNVITVASITAANHNLAKSGGGLVSVDYMSISRSQAAPGTTWYAGTHSTDGGNNSGWTFTAPSTGDDVVEVLMGADAVDCTVVYALAITESGAAADAPSGTEVTTAAVSESGAAADAVTGSTISNLIEAGAADDDLAGMAVSLGNLVETGATSDAILAITFFSLSESGSAADALTGLAVDIVAMSELGVMADVLDGDKLHNGAIAETGAAASTVAAQNVALGLIAETPTLSAVLSSQVPSRPLLFELVDAEDAPAAVQVSAVLVMEFSGAVDAPDAGVIQTPTGIIEALSAEDDVDALRVGPIYANLTISNRAPNRLGVSDK